MSMWFVDCCVLVLFTSGKRPCGLQSLLYSGFVCVGKCACALQSLLRSGFVRIGKMSMWFEKHVAFWFCSHQKNVHVVCKACCVLVLFASEKRPCGLQSLLYCLAPFATGKCPVVCKDLCSVLFASGKWPCSLQSLDSLHPCLLQSYTILIWNSSNISLIIVCLLFSFVACSQLSSIYVSNIWCHLIIFLVLLMLWNHHAEPTSTVILQHSNMYNSL